MHVRVFNSSPCFNNYVINYVSFTCIEIPNDHMKLTLLREKPNSMFYKLHRLVELNYFGEKPGTKKMVLRHETPYMHVYVCFYKLANLPTACSNAMHFH